MSNPAHTSSSKHTLAGLGVRLFCMLYDTLLVSGLMMCVGLVYGLITDQRQPMQGRFSLQILMILVITAYFVGFWSSRQGQTLAMRTWRLRIITIDENPLNIGRAMQRFALSWLWIVPGAIVLACHTETHHVPPIKLVGMVMGLSMLCYLGLTLVLPNHQYLHDILCRTRLIKAST